MEINPLQGIYQEIKTIIDNSVIKYNTKARKYETLEITRSADQYISALLGEDTFYSYMTYDKEFMSKLGIVDIKTVELYMDNRRNIPEIYHDRLLKMKREKVIKDYVEKNNYYRTMLGLPDLDDNEFIYVDDNISTRYNIPKDIPIHELETPNIVVLSEIGYLDKIKHKYSGKEYISYLGYNAIDLISARRAKHLSLLRAPVNVSEIMLNNFKLIYEQCREYFMSTIYSEEYVTIYEFYDNFIALCVMVMTIQQLIARSCKMTIDREFFDEYSIQLLYENYNIPFIKELDIESQKAIVQNLNILIQYKGTDKVLYDIASLLGYDRIKIFKYYLMKEQMFDEDDMPIDRTKTIINEYGEEEEVPDYEAMYDVYFQKIELNERDYHKGLQSSNNRTGYREMIDSDPYWWEDNDSYKQLYEDEYNFKETKYLSMNIAYRLSEVMFETIYLVRMVLDKKNELYGVNLQLPKILGSHEVSLFNTMVALCAMVCKKNNLKGEILYDESKILHVLGFNFNQDFNVIRKHIRDNPLLDNIMLDYLESMTIYTPESVNRIYSHIKGLRDFITEKLSASSNIHEYRAYQTLYKALYISEENKELFSIGTNIDTSKYARTYLEYLEFSHSELYNFIINSSDSELSIYIDHIIVRLTDIIPTIKFLYVTNDTNNAIMDALLTLIRFFKSYTTDMIGMNIVYIFDTKALNMLKLIDDIHHMQKNISINDTINTSFSDIIHSLILRMGENDKFTLIDKISAWVHLQWYDTLKLRDDYSSKAMISHDEYIYIRDLLSIYKNIGVIDFISQFNDKLAILGTLNISGIISFTEYVSLKKHILTDETIKLYDIIELSVRNNHGDTISIVDYMYTILSKLYDDDKISMDDVIISLNKEIAFFTPITLYDILTVSKVIESKSSMKFKDTIRISYKD